MSEANPLTKRAERRAVPKDELARAVLELFEMLVASAVDKGDNITRLGDWADEWKPRLERIIRDASSKTQLPPE